MLERLIDVPASSLWLTPNQTPDATTNNGANAGRPATGKSLAKQARGDWPTPIREDSESRTAHGMLTDAAREWPTPQTTDAKSAARHTTTTGVMHPGTTLTDAVRQIAPSGLWQTPQSRDQKGVTQGVAQGDYTDALPDQLAGLHDRENLSTTGNLRGSSPRPVLNPRWVALLMGFPVDWLDGVEPPSARSATRSFRRSPKSSASA